MCVCVLLCLHVCVFVFVHVIYCFKYSQVIVGESVCVHYSSIYRRCVLWIKVGSVECGKLVDWAACVCATIDYPGPIAARSAMFAHFKFSVNSCPCRAN